MGINLSKETLINDLYKFYNKKVVISDLSNENWNISTKIELNIKEKIKNLGTPLIKWNVKINYGIKTGYNDAFIIDGIIKNNLISIDKNSSKIIKKLIRGKDIKRYYTDSPDLWLIESHNGYKKDNGDIVPPININDYPAIKDWLDRFYNELNSRSDKGITPYNLRNCAYQQDFEKNKVVWTPVNSKYSFSFVDKDVFFNNSLFMITGGQSLYFCAIFNSKLIRKYIEFLLGGEGDYSYGSKEIIEQIPIPKISPEYQLPFIEKVDKILEITKQPGYNPKEVPEEQKRLEKEIDKMVYELYGLSEEEVRVVEESLEK